MKKIILITIALYVISIIISFVYPYYISIAPFFFMLLLLVVIVYRKQHADMTKAIEQQRSKSILYMGIALILAPILVGLLLVI